MCCRKQRVQDGVDALQDELLALSHFIHHHPETGLKEFQAVNQITSLLKSHHVDSQIGLCGLETAFIATVEGCGPGPHVALLAEYDALAGIGHGCGHNVIATCAAGAFLSASSVMAELPGRVSLIGTPAEETYGGKCTLVRQGAFDDVDFALMIHPTAAHSLINRSGRAVATITVKFIGASAHSAHPQTGVNALSAAIELFNGIDRIRPTLLLSDNINGVILDGGHAANVIPGETICSFCVRSCRMLELESLVASVRRVAEASAAMIGVQMEFCVENMLYERYPNLPMSEAFKANMALLGEEMEYADPQKLYGSSDIGDVSIFVPIIHDYLRISTRDGVNEHSQGFARDAISPRADEICIKGAKGLAMTAVDLFENAGLRERILQYHKEHVPASYRKDDQRQMDAGSGRSRRLDI